MRGRLRSAPNPEPTTDSTHATASTELLFSPFPAKDFASVPAPISDAILSLEMLRWETQMHTNRNGANKAHAPTVSARAAERPASLPAQSPHACADYKPTPRELRRGFAGAFFSEVAREG